MARAHAVHRMVINNAGIVGGEVEQVDPASHRNTFQVNANGLVAMTTASRGS